MEERVKTELILRENEPKYYCVLESKDPKMQNLRVSPKCVSDCKRIDEDPTKIDMTVGLFLPYERSKEGELMCLLKIARDKEEYNRMCAKVYGALPVVSMRQNVEHMEILSTLIKRGENDEEIKKE